MISVPLLLGGVHDCSYLPKRQARSVFVDPSFALNRHTYSQLVALGFRRSGSLVYRPRCDHCDACIPVRVSASHSLPTRSHRRTAQRNRDLSVAIRPAAFSEESYQLFLRYQSVRHEGGGMAEMSRSEFIDFLRAPWDVSRFVEFRDTTGELLAVAVIDELSDGFSAVYTFFEPNLPQRGLGTWAVLWLIGEAKRRQLPWIYLGFWIEDCPKMRYKRDFQPLEVLSGHGWGAFLPNRSATTRD